MLEVDLNPYGTDIDTVLEDEVYSLMKEVEELKLKIKVTKTKDFLRKMLKVKERQLERLIDEHPEGPEFFLYS